MKIEIDSSEANGGLLLEQNGNYCLLTLTAADTAGLWVKMQLPFSLKDLKKLFKE